MSGTMMNTGTPKEIRRDIVLALGQESNRKNIYLISKYNILNCCYYYKGKIQGQMRGVGGAVYDLLELKQGGHRKSIIILKT